MLTSLHLKKGDFVMATGEMMGSLGDGVRTRLVCGSAGRTRLLATVSQMAALTGTFDGPTLRMG